MRLLAPAVAVLVSGLALSACTSSGGLDTTGLASAAAGQSGASLLSGLGSDVGTATWALQHAKDLTALGSQLSTLNGDQQSGSASAATSVCASLLSESTRLLSQPLPPDPTVAQQLRSALQSTQTAARSCVNGDSSAALSELQSALGNLGGLPSTP
jgi:hypothetical protein